MLGHLCDPLPGTRVREANCCQNCGALRSDPPAQVCAPCPPSWGLRREPWLLAAWSADGNSTARATGWLVGPSDPQAGWRVRPSPSFRLLVPPAGSAAASSVPVVWPEADSRSWVSRGHHPTESTPAQAAHLWPVSLPQRGQEMLASSLQGCDSFCFVSCIVLTCFFALSGDQCGFQAHTAASFFYVRRTLTRLIRGWGVGCSTGRMCWKGGLPVSLGVTADCENETV